MVCLESKKLKIKPMNGEMTGFMTAMIQRCSATVNIYNEIHVLIILAQHLLNHFREQVLLNLSCLKFELNLT